MFIKQLQQLHYILYNIKFWQKFAYKLQDVMSQNVTLNGLSLSQSFMQIIREMCSATLANGVQLPVSQSVWGSVMWRLIFWNSAACYSELMGIYCIIHSSDSDVVLFLW